MLAKHKKAIGIFANVVLVFGFLIITFTAGYIIGKDRGYYQRRTAEVEIGKMLAKRARVYKRPY